MSDCEYQWESDEPCRLPFHRCINRVQHIGPHVCICGERLKLGQKWEIASSIDPKTGKRHGHPAHERKG